MKNRLDETNCPELDPMTYAMPSPLLGDELKNMGLTLDPDTFNLLRDGKSEGCVAFDHVGAADTAWAFIFLNPVHDPFA